MTVSTTATRQTYATDGVTANFPVPFVFFESSGVRVFFVSSAGVRTLQAEGTDYTVSGGDGQSGTVEFTSAPAAGGQVELYLWYDPTQLVDLVDTGRLGAETLERMVDRVTILTQQVMSRTGGTQFKIGAVELILLNDALTAWQAGGRRIAGVADAVDATDAVSKSYVDGKLLVAGNLPLPSVGQIGLSLVAVADATSATGARFDIRAVKASDVAGLGTAASEDIGTAAGQIAVLGSGGVFDNARIDTGVTSGKVIEVDVNDELPPALLPAASNAQMAAASVDNRAATPANLVRSPFTAAAWGLVNQIGTQAIVAQSGGLTISDEGTGITRVTLASAMASANYAVVIAGPDSTIVGVENRTTTTFDIRARSGANITVDKDGLMFAVFGELA